jgi:hypothetical protein
MAGAFFNAVRHHRIERVHRHPDIETCRRGTVI